MSMRMRSSCTVTCDCVCVVNLIEDVLLIKYVNVSAHEVFIQICIHYLRLLYILNCSRRLLQMCVFIGLYV